MIQEAPDTYGSLFDRISASVKARPEALLLFAAGCALLMLGGRDDEGRDGGGSRFAGASEDWRDRASDVASRGQDYADKARDTASSYLDSASEKASSYSDDLSRQAGHYTDRASRAAGSYVEGLQTYGSHMGDRLAETSGHLRERARDSIDAGVDMLTDQPLLLAALGIAAGIAAAAVIPRSQIEEDALDTVRERVEDFGDETGDHIANAAERASETLAREVRERGLTPDGLKDVASKVASSVTEAMVGAEPSKEGQGGKSDNKPPQAQSSHSSSAPQTSRPSQASSSASGGNSPSPSTSPAGGASSGPNRAGEANKNPAKN